MKIGEIIRDARTKKGYSLRGLSRACGIKPNTLCNIELGKVTPRDVTITRICEVLDVSELAVRYAAICGEYSDALAGMWDTTVEWLRDDYASVDVADCIISNQELRFLVDNRIAYEDFIKWYDYDLDIHYGKELGDKRARRVSMQSWFHDFPEELKVTKDVREDWNRKYWEEVRNA